MIYVAYINEIEFITKSCKDLSTEEISKCSELFSNHYGIWGEADPKGRSGNKILLSHKYYEKLTTKDDHYVALAFDKDQLVGHAFYIRKNINNEGYMSWVLQIVVHLDYRRQSIGKTLLYSIWGFSGDNAWGLATTNPHTVKTLESATFRKVEPNIILAKIDQLKKFGRHIEFVEDYVVDSNHTLVNTNFYIDHSEVREKIEEYGSLWKLKELKEGHEWLAFTFKDQKLREISEKEFNNSIEYSERLLKAAYSRMKMPEQAWTKYTEHEVNYIIKKLDLVGSERLADFGCGFGRHVIEFSKKGFDIKGFDFVKSNIQKAKKLADNNGLGSIEFIEADCREINPGEKFDLILCLYDVIGSFPNEKDNMKILENIYQNLKSNGHAVISVMNMELTNHLVKFKTDISKDPLSLINLKPSNTMQTKGDIFNPEHYIIDSKSNLVYRKEQFENDGQLSAEYVIRDKRYTLDEITYNLKKVGFKIIESSYVQAGNWQTSLTSTDNKAKEILLFLRK